MHLGSGRHAYYLSRQQILEAARWTHVSQPWILLVYSTARISVALLTLRFIGVASFWRRWLLIYVMVSSLIVNVLTIALSLSQCSPRSALWNHNIPGATCWPKNVMMSYTYFLFAYNCFCDVVLALLPATFIYKLQMNSAKKRILTVVLGLGLL